MAIRFQLRAKLVSSGFSSLSSDNKANRRHSAANSRQRFGLEHWHSVRLLAEAVLHANTIKSPITIRVFTPAIITPRQISAGMLSDGSLICLRSTAFPMRLPSPIISLGSRGFVPGQMYKSELKKGERAGPAYFGGCSSPFNQPVALLGSAGRVRRNRSIGTSVVPCHSEAALGSRKPRNGGKLVVWPVPCDKFRLSENPSIPRT